MKRIASLILAVGLISIANAQTLKQCDRGGYEVSFPNGLDSEEGIAVVAGKRSASGEYDVQLKAAVEKSLFDNGYRVMFVESSTQVLDANHLVMVLREDVNTSADIVGVLDMTDWREQQTNFYRISDGLMLGYIKGSTSDWCYNALLSRIVK